ncbi:hypothetical protein V8C35DRAFT_305245 [Trichoderma chlorosporum]
MEPPTEDQIRKSISTLDKDQLQRLWELRELTSSLDNDRLQAMRKLHDKKELGPLLDLAKRAPKNIWPLVNDTLKTQALHDYVTEFETRRNVVDRIGHVVAKSPRFRINAALVAVFMVAPVETLKQRLSALEETYRQNIRGETEQMLNEWRDASLEGIRTFANKGADSPQNYWRSSEAVKLCKRRDDDRCLFTGMPDPQAAHILPFAVSKNGTTPLIMKMLEMFWGANVVNQLSTLLNDREITESPQNLLSMNQQLHAWFDGNKMALRPLGLTKRGDGVDVQFYWLNESYWKPDDTCPPFDYFEILARTGGVYPGKLWGSKLAHRPSGLRLETGQVFTVTSLDPNHLPSRELLELSWDLVRVAAICGASGELREDSSTDEDGDDYYCEDDAISDEINDGYLYQSDVEIESESETGIEVDEDTEIVEDRQPGDDAESPL